MGNGEPESQETSGSQRQRFSIPQLVKAEVLRETWKRMREAVPAWLKRKLRRRYAWMWGVAGGIVFLTLSSRVGAHSAQNARYLLSAEAQVLAAILGLSGTGVLVVAQMTASAYSPRVARFLFDKWVWSALVAYASVIVVSLLLISFLPKNELRWFLRLWVGGDFLLGAACVGGIVVFVRHVMDLLRVGTLLERIQGRARRTLGRPRGDVGEARIPDLPTRFQASLDLALGALTRSDFATASDGLHVAATICQERVSRLGKDGKYRPLDEMARGVCYLAKRLENVGGPPYSMHEVLDELSRINGLLGDCGHDNRPLLTPIVDLHGIATSAPLKRSVFWFFLQAIVRGSRRTPGNDRAFFNSCMAALCLAKLRVNWADKPVDWVNEPDLYCEYELQMGSWASIWKEFNRFMYAAGVFYRRNRTPERPGRTRTSLPYGGEEQDFAQRYEELNRRFDAWRNIEEGTGDGILEALESPGDSMPEFVRGWAIGFLPHYRLDEQALCDAIAEEDSEFFLLRFAERLHTLQRQARENQMEKRWSELCDRVRRRIRTEQGQKCYEALMSR